MKRRTKQGDPKLAVAYLRVSTDDQKLGPEAQRAAITGWAQREGITVASWHTDQGVSGGSELDDRPGLVAALGEVSALGAGILAIAKRDRLARDVGVVAAIERAVAQGGARVVAADGVGNGDGAGDQFMRRVIDAAAEYERALIQMRTKAALAVKRGRGEYCGGDPPYGFDQVEGKLVPNTGELRAIRIAAGLREDGRSLRFIARRLAQCGHRARDGKMFCAAQVRSLLMRPEASTA